SLLSLRPRCNSQTIPSTNPKVLKPAQEYRDLHDTYNSDPDLVTGDFAERMTGLLSRIGDSFSDAQKSISSSMISRGELTQRMYAHDLHALRKQLTEYLAHKSGVWILIDNLDKGWPSHGVNQDDTLIIRCLAEALFQLTKYFRRASIEGFAVMFVRNDVYSLLMDHSSDRGKISQASIDWSDPDLLRELIRLRLIAGDETLQGLSFETVWGKYCVSHVDGEESSEYLIDRCLMRPRALIELVSQCRSHAVNLNKVKIDESDFIQGEAAFSSNLVTNIALEVRDIMPEAEDFAYGFIERKSRLSEAEVCECLAAGTNGGSANGEMLDVLLWFAFLGVLREDGTEAYIHSVKYDMKRLKALISRIETDKRVYCINKAFWAGLEIKEVV
ncbi:MAG: hypothetical protein KDA52_22230, partial [Planctomycetaceae bacterium]|nr:hypothetical protein [Planctomycetaceae bacterium]